MFKRMKTSWGSHTFSIAVLRLWLGITWVYAGWYKATDPQFLTPNTSGYIGTQLANYQLNSPISFLLRHMVEHAGIVGLFVMLSEFAIGFATLTGFMLVYASLGGLLMSATLWLSASWTVKPYFLGSDTAYMVMWAVLLGSIFKSSRKLKLPNFTDRREVISLASIAGLSILGVVIGKAFTRKAQSNLQSQSSSSSSQAIAKVSDISIGKAIHIKDAQGAPGYIFRTKAGVFAYSAICTHQGCTVNFNSDNSHFQCPCHGAEFDPANGAKVLAGPAPSPLTKIKISVQGNNIFLA
jgi:nitrite reductase/ring-hydroxylating ferredoxin subunit/uncharacterized membrane protein YphA (DoxX/SURF4 family)